MNKAYLKNFSFISFIWRPKAFFENLAKRPIILFPLLILFIYTLIKVMILFNHLPVLTDSTKTSTFLFYLLIQMVTVFGFIFLSGVIIYVLYLLVNNKQNFKNIIAILLHAYLAYMYVSILFDLFNTVFASEGSLQLFRMFASFIIVVYFIYTGLGLTWGIDGTKTQFMIVFSGYIVIFLILALVFMLVIGFMIASLMTDIMELFEIILF